MNLEQQVCSLDLAKRLKELGVKQSSLCEWRFTKEGKNSSIEPQLGVIKEPEWFDYCSAFTVAELGEMLPVVYEKGDKRWFLKTQKDAGIESKKVFWTTWYWSTSGDIDRRCDADTEADARAKMLIYLIENKLIEASSK